MSSRSKRKKGADLGHAGRFEAKPDEHMRALHALAAPGPTAPSLELMEKLRKNLEAVAPLAAEFRGQLPQVSAGDLAVILMRRVEMASHVFLVKGMVLGTAEQALRGKAITEDQHKVILEMVKAVLG